MRQIGQHLDDAQVQRLQHGKQEEVARGQLKICGCRRDAREYADERHLLQHSRMLRALVGCLENLQETSLSKLWMHVSCAVLVYQSACLLRINCSMLLLPSTGVAHSMFGHMPRKHGSTCKTPSLMFETKLTNTLPSSHISSPHPCQHTCSVMKKTSQIKW